MNCGQESAEASSPADSPALVVGGTGMLSGVVRGLVSAGHPTAVVARDVTRLRRVAETTGDPGLVIAVASDYAEPGALAAALGAALDAAAGAGAMPPTARIGTAVLWVHSPHRRRVHEALTRVLADDALVVDVLGSSALDPTRAVTPVPAALLARTGVTYRRVVLGFADGPAGTRWLTHEEISLGVLASVDAGRTPAGPGVREDTAVVGRVRPWSRRPR